MHILFFILLLSTLSSLSMELDSNKKALVTARLNKLNIESDNGKRFNTNPIKYHLNFIHTLNLPENDKEKLLYSFQKVCNYGRSIVSQNRLPTKENKKLTPLLLTSSTSQEFQKFLEDVVGQPRLQGYTFLTKEFEEYRSGKNPFCYTISLSFAQYEKFLFLRSKLLEHKKSNNISGEIVRFVEICNAQAKEDISKLKELPENDTKKINSYITNLFNNKHEALIIDESFYSITQYYKFFKLLQNIDYFKESQLRENLYNFFYPSNKQLETLKTYIDEKFDFSTIENQHDMEEVRKFGAEIWGYVDVKVKSENNPKLSLNTIIKLKAYLERIYLNLRDISLPERESMKIFAGCFFEIAYTKDEEIVAILRKNKIHRNYSSNIYVKPPVISISFIYRPLENDQVVSSYSDKDKAWYEARLKEVEKAQKELEVIGGFEESQDAVALGNYRQTLCLYQKDAAINATKKANNIIPAAPPKNTGADQSKNNKPSLKNPPRFSLLKRGVLLLLLVSLMAFLASKYNWITLSHF